MADETNVNQDTQTQQTATDSTSVNNAGNGQQQGEQSDPKWLDARLKRAEEAREKKLLADLGVDSADDLKALLADAKKRREAEMSEADKAKADADKYKAKLDAAEQRAAALEQARTQDRVDSALRTAAITARADHPDDVIDLLRKTQAEGVAGVIDTEGKIDEAKVKKLIEDARKARPNYFASTGVGSPSTRGGQNPDPNKTKTQPNSKPLFKL